MRRHYAAARQHRRPGCYPPGLLLLPAGLLLFALYTVSRSSVFSTDNGHLGKIDVRHADKAQGVAAHALLGTTAEPYTR